MTATTTGYNLMMKVPGNTYISRIFFVGNIVLHYYRPDAVKLMEGSGHHLTICGDL